MRSDWVLNYPKATKALLMAVLEAQIWCDKLANKPEMCEIIAGRKYFNVPARDILDRTLGNFDFGNGQKFVNSPLRMRFWETTRGAGDVASYPYRSHDLWFLIEILRWCYLPADTDTQSLISRVNREGMWRSAARAIGQADAIPRDTSRGVETFFDGVVFDPAQPMAYLNRQPIKAVPAQEDTAA